MNTDLLSEPDALEARAPAGFRTQPHNIFLHFNPGNHKHGMEAKEGAHAGDMPNLHIPANGELVIEIANPSISLVKGQPNSLFDADGSAIVIHAGVDDYKTDPAGNAGDRIICGVVTE